MRTLFPWSWLGVAVLGVLADGLPAGAQPVPPPPKYAAAVKELRAWVAHEMRDKDVPALSVAVVEDGHMIWSEGFGVADRKANTPAGPDTLYRTSRLSEHLIQVAAAMQAEQGQLNLDAPVTKYLPTFAPKNPFKQPMTLRHLLEHTSGLGSDWPDGRPGQTLAQRVASLNQTSLMFAPGSRYRYSAAGLGVVAHVLERSQKESFAAVLQRTLLGPIGVKHGGYALTPEQRKLLAVGQRWTYLGQTSDAAAYQARGQGDDLHMTAPDYARVLGFLAGDGKAGGKRLLAEKTLKALQGDQSPKVVKGEMVSPFVRAGMVDGQERVTIADHADGTTGAGALLRKDQFGVVVLTAKGGAAGLTWRVAVATLDHFQAARQGKALPALERVEPLDAATAGRLAGVYVEKNSPFAEPWKLLLLARGHRLRLLPLFNGNVAEVKRSAGGYRVDGLVFPAQPLTVKGEELVLGGKTFVRQAPAGAPPEPPAGWRGLLGHYQAQGRDVVVLEMEGRLFLQDGVMLRPLREAFNKGDQYNVPVISTWEEAVTFARDKQGRATGLEWKQRAFPRRRLDGEDGQTFQIKPQRPLDELRKEALQAKPPAEKPDLRKPELVDLAKLDAALKFDIRYATENNFLGTKFYTSARAFLQKPAAEALLRAHQKLRAEGYGLLIYDAYRPWHVTKMFWEATPPHLRNFVADPALGSRHNRGCAVDLALYDLKSGQPVEMPSGFDEMSDRAYPDYLGGTSRQRWYRDLLRRFMEAEGFTVYEDEWWHFDYRDWRLYPILNQRFEELGW
jgi:serine beta-lactamase-like protein LACTB